MRLNTALLADAAHTRDRLLYIIGGGITRIWRPEYPSPLNLDVGLMLEIHPTEFDRPHEITIRGMDEDGEHIVEVRGAVQATAGEDHDVGESALVPAVLGLRNVGLPHPGVYTLEIVIDGQHQTSIRFRADQR
ncbi:MAG: DUF6941 family protein [Actinomycetota bacterium]